MRLLVHDKGEFKRRRGVPNDNSDTATARRSSASSSCAVNRSTLRRVSGGGSEGERRRFPAIVAFARPGPPGRPRCPGHLRIEDLKAVPGRKTPATSGLELAGVEAGRPLEGPVSRRPREEKVLRHRTRLEETIPAARRHDPTEDPGLEFKTAPAGPRVAPDPSVTSMADSGPAAQAGQPFNSRRGREPGRLPGHRSGYRRDGFQATAPGWRRARHPARKSGKA